MENLPTPLSRVELYLAKACGMDVAVPEQPIGRLEQFLAILAGDTSITMPTPIGLTEQWLAYVLGVTPDPLLAVEGACLIGAQKVDVRYFAVAASMPGATLPEAPQNRAEMYWAHIAVNPPTPGILKYVTGKYFNLTDVVSGIEELQYLKGDTVQDGTPTPDAPIAVQTVTGAQTVTVTGKNRFNIQDSTGTRGNNTVVANNQTIIVNSNTNGTETTFYLNNCSYISQYLPTSYSNARDFNMTGMGGDYTLKVYYQNIPSGTGALNTCIYTNKQTILKNRGTIADGNVEVNISLDNDEYIKSVALYTANTNVFNNFTIKAQLESNATATTYEPYQSQSYTVDLGSIELCKLGDYQDYIYKSGDDWYVHKECNNITIPSTNWTLGLSGQTIYYTSTIVDYAISDNTPFCSAFKGMVNVNGVYGANANPDNSCAFINVSGSTTPRFYIKSSKFATAGALYTWITNNSPTICYALETPTDTKITDATLVGQLEALNSAQLPKPIANITVSATGTNLTPYLTIAYYGSDEE